MKSLHSTHIRQTAVLLVAAGLSFTPAFADSSKVLPNFQKVNDHVYRGGQPSDEGFKTLAKLGIKTIIDLREIGEHSQADEKRIVNTEGMQYVSIPMQGMSAPTGEAMQKVLSYLNDESAGPVFVHCRRGADRTGTVIAVYRIGHDQWANKKALSEARGYGMSMWERAMMHYVKGYKAPAANAGVTEATISPEPKARAAAVGVSQ
jgi:tyrosine-protein phosphatase SIW14